MPEIAEGSLNSVILECHKHMDIKLAEMLMLQSEGYNIWTEDLDAEEVDSVDIYAMYVYPTNTEVGRQVIFQMIVVYANR